MGAYTYIEDAGKGKATIRTIYGDLTLLRSDLEELQVLIAGYLGGTPFNLRTLNGLVTKVDGATETIYGWFGDYSSAEYVASRIFAKGGADGTRAYALIRQFGRDVDTERTFNFDVGDDTDTDGTEDGVEDTPTKKMATLDDWGE